MSRPLVKVCGMTRMQDVELCVDLGVDLLGFIFHPKSPRNADPDFVASVKTGKVSKVGVFVNQTAEEVLETMERCGLHAAQLHGGQDVDFCWKIGPDRVIRAFWPDTYPSPQALLRGTGNSIDIAMLQDIEILTPWFLAGGLGPHNIKEALTANPSGLDINSGVEKAPGIKDETKLREVFRILAAME